MAMQDPTSGVQQQLLPHVHLRSSISYPYAPNILPFEQILDQLLRAPQTVRELPVAWTYLTPPADGTLMLIWRPANTMGRPFGTDGIVWTGAENTVLQDVRGYTVEVAIFNSGFIPTQDQFTIRRRMRYRLIANANNMPVDPSLELVHWIAASADGRMPTRMVQLQPTHQQLMRERRYLEMQGPLPRKEFMLNDRGSWPTITLPGSSVPQNPYQNPIQGRPGVPGFQRTPSGSRPMIGQPGGGMPGLMVKPGQLAVPAPTPFANLAEDILENERNTEFGDSLDFLSPREISATRYKQHHEWMEEIVSSPYAINQILPVALNLRLSGALKSLTDGLWEDAAAMEADGTPAVPGGAAKRVDPARFKAFEEKMATHLSQGEQELADMRKAHAIKMEEIKQQRLLVNLERRLAETSKDGSLVSLEEITRDIEQALGGKLVPKQDVLEVSRGGLLSKSELMSTLTTHQQQPEAFDADFSNLDSAGEALEFFGQDMVYTA